MIVNLLKALGNTPLAIIAFFKPLKSTVSLSSMFKNFREEFSYSGYNFLSLQEQRLPDEAPLQRKRSGYFLLALFYFVKFIFNKSVRVKRFQSWQKSL